MLLPALHPIADDPRSDAQITIELLWNIAHADNPLYWRYHALARPERRITLSVPPPALPFTTETRDRLVAQSLISPSPEPAWDSSRWS